MSSIKISWGVRIAFLYIGFVALIVFLVTGSMKQDVDLVADDYYEQELVYQQVLDAGKNQSTLSEPLQIHANETNVTIDFPDEFDDKMITGNIHFYSPQKPAWDKRVAMNGIQSTIDIPRADLQRTGYKIKVSWNVDGKSYYQESDINLF